MGMVTVMVTAMVMGIIVMIVIRGVGGHSSEDSF